MNATIVAFAAARRLPFQPPIGLQMQLVERDAKRRGDARCDSQRGIFLVVLHSAEHLPGNAGRRGEPAQRPAAPFAPPPDDARQRPVFRHGQSPRHMPPGFGSCLLIFHKSQFAPPGGTKAVLATKQSINLHAGYFTFSTTSIWMGLLVEINSKPSFFKACFNLSLSWLMTSQSRTKLKSWRFVTPVSSTTGI